MSHIDTIRRGAERGLALVQEQTNLFQHLLDEVARFKTSAASDVIAEMERQRTAEGWTPDQDTEELAFSVACYATAYHDDHPPSVWPLTRWNPADRRRNLVKACAMMLGEIESLDRADKSATDQDAQEQYKSAIDKLAALALGHLIERDPDVANLTLRAVPLAQAV